MIGRSIVRLNASLPMRLNMIWHKIFPRIIYIVLICNMETSVGTWEWKHYLLDPTLAQFADTRCARLLATPAGAEFGTQLLTHGYAELTEAAAACYIDAFIPPILRKQWRQEFNENNCSSIAILCQPNARQGNNNADFLCNIKERLGHSP